ncbi:unnamed protein product [Tilletia controversa]|uniref:Sterol regulatory element-binding protein cleavage-activating protein n=1 Tax=Tilletia controversa TaxID=13291 RepID=A0A8X7SXS7_9BASI|nr:hypothetical protein A4X06_0g3422 [Tilletia controversa]CAD6906778.1 unnamed protein product [Tilletia controversa]CAD6946721.1 unnamed protein product [Tilletia controversa]CAD6978943.1 unnamed protein product [Tilletia controversa]CAD6986478.1 unnamed protein product [Tilletia controversa]
MNLPPPPPPLEASTNGVSHRHQAGLQQPPQHATQNSDSSAGASNHSGLHVPPQNSLPSPRKASGQEPPLFGSGQTPPKNAPYPSLNPGKRRTRAADRVDSRSAIATRNAAISTLEAFNADLERRFRRHGRYVSRHQIRVLLLCSLVITSLFYPAVGIYFWSSKGGPGVTRGSAASVWRSLSTPFIDSFISSGRKHHNSIRDLRMIWDDATDMRALDAKDARALFGSSPQVPDTSIRHPLFPYGGVPLVQGHHHHDGDGKESDTHPSADDLHRKPSRPSCRTVRVEHVFVTTDDVLTGQAHRFGVLEPRILSSSLRLQNSIEYILRERDPKRRQRLGSSAYRIPECARVHRIEDLSAGIPGELAGAAEGSEDEVVPQAVKEPECLTLSPNDYWASDAQALMADTAPTQTILQSVRNLTDRSIPLRISTTLAGRWHLFKKLPRAEHLAMTFFLEDETAGDDCSQGQDTSVRKESQSVAMSSSHRAWMQMLANVTAGQVTIIPSEYEEAKELLLQFTPDNPRASLPASKLLLFAGYFSLAAYLAHGLLKMRNVHSRLGIVFTCITELCISLITSVSICALIGVRLTLLPWEILPFVIAVIGSENMFNLTAAIVDTPVDLPVTSRVAIGLSQVGIPILITVLSDVFLLGTMAFFITVRAVHEFCIFAICSLVIDYFMQMTFFITVLSVDLQRLELAEVLAQGGRVPAPSSLQNAQNPTGVDKADTPAMQRFLRRGSTSSRRSSSLLQKGGRALWRARTARTASLSLLIGLMFGIYLYYGTGYPQAPDFPYPLHAATAMASSSSQASSDSLPDGLGFDPLAHLSPSSEEANAMRQRLQVPWWIASPSGPFWHALNPQGAPKVRVHVEPWTIISLRSAHPHFDGPTNKSFAVWALFRPRIRAVIWFLKLVILPITGTTTLLFFLLLYLLKDTDLLDAQNGKDEAETDTDRSDDEVDADSHGPALDLTFTPAGAGHAADIMLTATSQAWVASIDATGKLSYWRYSRSKRVSPVSVKHSSYAGPDGARPTALAITSAGGLVTIGLSDGRICIVVLSTSKVNPSYDPATGSDPVPTLPVQNITIHDGDGEQAHVVIVSQHRDGSAWRWVLDSRKPSCIVRARSHCRWQAFNVSMCSPALDNTGHTVHRLFGLASSKSVLELRTCSVEQDKSVRTFSAPQTQGRLMRCAALASLMPIQQSGGPKEILSLITGSSDGTVDLWDHQSSNHLGSVELGSGPITSLRVIEERERGTILVCASMSSSVALLRLSYGGHTEGSVTASMSQSSVGGLPFTPLGNYRTPAGIKFASPPWAAPPAVSTSTSLAPNLPAPFETYRLSGHNGSMKYRRNGSYFGSEVGNSSMSGSALGIHESGTQDSIDPLSSPNEPSIPLPSLSPSGPQPIVIQDLGRIVNERGVMEVVKQSILVGIRRRFGLSRTGGARWEAWALDTSRDLHMQDGTVEVIASELDLDHCGSAAGPVRLIDSRPSTGNLPSPFQSTREVPRIVAEPSTGSRGMLSFTQLHSIRELVTSTPMVAIAFGNVVATLSLRIFEPEPTRRIGRDRKQR